MRIIINADDFDLTQGINDAIIKCYQEGVLSSTTPMQQQSLQKKLLNSLKKIQGWEWESI